MNALVLHQAAQAAFVAPHAAAYLGGTAAEHLAGPVGVGDELAAHGGAVDAAFGLSLIHISDRAQQAAVEAAQKGDPAFGRTRGVLSEVVNQITSGSIVVTAVAAAASITGSESGGVALLVVVFALGLAVFWFFIQNVFPVVMRRVFLEGMLYDRVTPSGFCSSSGCAAGGGPPGPCA